MCKHHSWRDRRGGSGGAGDSGRGLRGWGPARPWGYEGSPQDGCRAPAVTGTPGSGWAQLQMGWRGRRLLLRGPDRPRPPTWPWAHLPGAPAVLVLVPCGWVAGPAIPGLAPRPPAFPSSSWPLIASWPLHAGLSSPGGGQAVGWLGGISSSVSHISWPAPHPPSPLLCKESPAWSTWALGQGPGWAGLLPSSLLHAWSLGGSRGASLLWARQRAGGHAPPLGGLGSLALPQCTRRVWGTW